VVNLRHALYSASLAPFLSHLPLRWRLTLAYLLTDEAFAVSAPRYRQPDTTHAHGYALGAGLALWVEWQLSTAFGIVFGARIPPTLSLEFALPLTFLAMLIPTLVDRPPAAAIRGCSLLLIAHDWDCGGCHLARIGVSSKAASWRRRMGPADRRRDLGGHPGRDARHLWHALVYPLLPHPERPRFLSARLRRRSAVLSAILVP
jgi:hypothetical protein